jgi:hypothetical protein
MKNSEVLALWNHLARFLQLKPEKQGMAELIQEYSTRITGEDGAIYIVRAYADQRSDGTWAGWIEFHSARGRKPVLRTGQETSQPNRVTVEYWASGLEPIYFEGAFARAQARLSP